MPFYNKRKIHEKLKLLTGQMVTNRISTLDWKEKIKLNLRMFERADSKTTKYYDHELACGLVDAFNCIMVPAR